MTLVGIAFKNLRRNPLRTGLTITSVAVAIVAFTFLRTMISAWTAQADRSSQSRVITRHKVSFVMKLPIRYAEEVRQVPHVKIVSYGTWFGLKVPTKEEEFFPSAAVDDQVVDVYGKDMSIPADQRETWLHDKTGLIVGRPMADKFGWKLGDRVTLVSRDYPNPPGGWTFTVDAIWNSPTHGWDEKWIYAHYDYANDFLPTARKNEIQWVVSHVDEPLNGNQVISAIDHLFAERELSTISQDEKTFTQGFLASMSAILSGVNVISFVILAIMALIIGNTIAMAVRERTSEYGVLRALGFSTRAIVLSIYGEAVFTALVGGVVGMLIAVPGIDFGIGPQVMKNMGNFFGSFAVPPALIATGLFLAALVGALAATIPALGTMRLRTVDALRHIG